MQGYNMDLSPAFALFDAVTRSVSPYHFNPYDINPLRDILAANVDFDTLTDCKDTKLFVGTTHVHSGKVRVFNTEEITLDVVMASACLPFLFKAIEIDGEHYWDGGYSGNPALFPFFYRSDCNDILIVHVNPIERPDVPTSAADIMNRVNEISFNGALLKELRAIDFVRKLMDEGWLKDEYADKLKRIFVHSVRADGVMRDLSVASKFNVNWDFLTHLRDRGRDEAQTWLDTHADDVGSRSTVDLKSEFLTIGGPHIG
jgi:NTE family protein